MKKHIVTVLFLLMIISLMGCSQAPSTTTTTTNPTTTPVKKEIDKNVIQFSKLTISKDTDITWKIVGEATNKDTVKHTYTAKVTYYDANKNIVYVGDASMIDIGPGETKTFTDDTDKDISKATYKIQINTIGD